MRALQEQAGVRGRSAHAAGEDVRLTVAEEEILRLSRKDDVRFAEALINPLQSISPARKRAAKRHAEMAMNSHPAEPSHQDDAVAIFDDLGIVCEKTRRLSRRLRDRPADDAGR